MTRSRILTGLNALQALCGLVLLALVVSRSAVLDSRSRVVWATFCGFAFLYDGAWRLLHEGTWA